jgi:NDP-sugar pyrophosphorylase family protein
MGTAGVLTLLTEWPSKPVIVMNGDLLAKVDFGNLLSFHQVHWAATTMCDREYDFQIPYGVVKVGHPRPEPARPGSSGIA